MNHKFSVSLITKKSIQLFIFLYRLIFLWITNKKLMLKRFCYYFQKKVGKILIQGNYTCHSDKICDFLSICDWRKKSVPFIKNYFATSHAKVVGGGGGYLQQPQNMVCVFSFDFQKTQLFFADWLHKSAIIFFILTKLVLLFTANG